MLEGQVSFCGMNSKEHPLASSGVTRVSVRQSLSRPKNRGEAHCLNSLSSVDSNFLLSVIIV